VLTIAWITTNGTYRRIKIDAFHRAFQLARDLKDYGHPQVYLYTDGKRFDF